MDDLMDAFERSLLLLLAAGPWRRGNQQAHCMRTMEQTTCPSGGWADLLIEVPGADCR